MALVRSCVWMLDEGREGAVGSHGTKTTARLNVQVRSGQTPYPYIDT